MSKHRTAAYFYLTLVALIWGVATYVIKATLVGIDPLPFLTYRFAISTLIALPMLYFAKKQLKTIFANFFLVFFYCFITTTFALGILFFGIDRTTVVDSAIISAVGPLLTAFAGAWFLKETVTKREKLGMTLAFVGTLITVFEPVIAGKDNFQVTGNALVVGYVVVMAYAAVLAKKLVRKGVDALALTNVSFIIGLATILPFTLAESSAKDLLLTINHLPLTIHLGVWYMAVLSGTLAYALWVRAQKSIEVSEAGLFNYLTPVFAAPLGILLLGEKVNFALLLGASLIIVGVVFAEIKEKKEG